MLQRCGTRGARVVLAVWAYAQGVRAPRALVPVVRKVVRVVRFCVHGRVWRTVVLFPAVVNWFFMLSFMHFYFFRCLLYCALASTALSPPSQDARML